MLHGNFNLKRVELVLKSRLEGVLLQGGNLEHCTCPVFVNLRQELLVVKVFNEGDSVLVVSELVEQLEHSFWLVFLKLGVSNGASADVGVAEF